MPGREHVGRGGGDADWGSYEGSEGAMTMARGRRTTERRPAVRRRLGLAPVEGALAGVIREAGTKYGGPRGRRSGDWSVAAVRV